jgi:hypothetical protein
MSVGKCVESLFLILSYVICTAMHVYTVSLLLCTFLMSLIHTKSVVSADSQNVLKADSQDVLNAKWIHLMSSTKCNSLRVSLLLHSQMLSLHQAVSKTLLQLDFVNQPLINLLGQWKAPELDQG